MRLLTSWRQLAAPNPPARLVILAKLAEGDDATYVWGPVLDGRVVQCCVARSWLDSRRSADHEPSQLPGTLDSLSSFPLPPSLLTFLHYIGHQLPSPPFYNSLSLSPPAKPSRRLRRRRSSLLRRMPTALSLLASLHLPKEAHLSQQQQQPPTPTALSAAVATGVIVDVDDSTHAAAAETASNDGGHRVSLPRRRRRSDASWAAVDEEGEGDAGDEDEDSMVSGEFLSLGLRW
jgi:hypothetical protein